MSEEQPLQVARCTKIIQDDKDAEKSKYVINVKQIAKFVVNLGERVSPTDIEEGMRVGVDRQKYSIMLPLPPKIDPSVTMMTVEEKPDVTYSDVGMFYSRGLSRAIPILSIMLPLAYPCSSTPSTFPSVARPIQAF